MMTNNNNPKTDNMGDEFYAVNMANKEDHPGMIRPRYTKTMLNFVLLALLGGFTVFTGIATMMLATHVFGQPDNNVAEHSLVARDAIVPSQFMNAVVANVESDTIVDITKTVLPIPDTEPTTTVHVTKTVSPVPQTELAIATEKVGTVFSVVSSHTWNQNGTAHLGISTGTGGTGLTSSTTIPMMTTGAPPMNPPVPDITPFLPSSFTNTDEVDSSSQMGISGETTEPTETTVTQTTIKSTTIKSTTIKTIHSITQTSTHTISATEEQICTPVFITVTVTALVTPLVPNPIPSPEISNTSSDIDITTTIWYSSPAESTAYTTIWDSAIGSSLDIPTTQISSVEGGTVAPCMGTGTCGVSGNATTRPAFVPSTTTITYTTTAKASSTDVFVTATAGAALIKSDGLSVLVAALPIALYYL